jgi:hypothetical protein
MGILSLIEEKKNDTSNATLHTNFRSFLFFFF